MRFIELNRVLQESAKSRYMTMLNGVPDVQASASDRRSLRDLIADDIDWAIRVLKRDDRIIWYIKWTRKNRTVYAINLAKNALQQNLPHLAQKTIDIVNARISALEAYAKKLGASPKDPNYGPLDVKRPLEHFLSLPVPSIQAVQFRDQTWKQLDQQFHELENSWQEHINKEKRYLTQEDEEAILTFPDGSAWFDLGKPSCDREAEAMGHCGNAGNPKSTDTVLSYRTPAKGGRWEPHLTFILDTQTGMLGEMKGRGNDKPNPRYHPQIVALLKSPIVKGILGGGYLQQNNFHLSDLNPQVEAELVDEKPILLLGKIEDLREKGKPVNYADPQVVRGVKALAEQEGLPGFTGEVHMIVDNPLYQFYKVYHTHVTLYDTVHDLLLSNNRKHYRTSTARLLYEALIAADTGDYSHVLKLLNLRDEAIPNLKSWFESAKNRMATNLEHICLIEGDSGTTIYVKCDTLIDDLSNGSIKQEGLDEYLASLLSDATKSIIGNYEWIQHTYGIKK